MKQQLTEKVKFLHKVAIVRTNQGQKEALILKRSSDSISRPNAWDLPGGNAEWPDMGQESTADLHQLDIAREVKEESNLLVEPSLFDFEHLIYFASYFEADRDLYSINCGWYLDFSESDRAEIKISTEHQEFVWVNSNDLNNYDFGGDRGRFVKNIINKALNK
jgi:8-oxo-dGTP pyrophosphatase MutT (NUDIX family)